MNKRFFSKIVVLAISLTVLFSTITLIISCAPSETINKYEYTANKATTDYASYSFDEELSIKKRNRFVTFSEQLLDYLQPETLADKKLDFVISSDTKIPRAESKEYSAYFSASDTKTVEFICYVLQALNTETLNYGLTYGLASKIYSELGWGRSQTISTSKMKKFLQKEKNRYILDLTYPVFHSKFSSKTQIKYAKAVSVSLADYIDRNYGKSAFDKLFEADLTFDNSFDRLFYGYLNEWLNTINISNVELISEVLKWIPYTDYAPIRLLTVTGDYHMDKDWEESGLRMLYEYRNFQSDYLSIKKFLIKSEQSFSLVREFFEYSQDSRCRISLENASAYSGLTDGKTIVINTMAALVSEYSRYVCYQRYGWSDSWMDYVVSYYCNAMFGDAMANDVYYGCHERKEFLKFYDALSDYPVYVLDTYIEAQTNDNYYLRYANGYSYGLFCDEENTFDKESIHSVFPQYFLNTHISVSFCYYLIETYGQQKFFELYKEGGSMFKAFNKAQTQVLEEYLEYLSNIFSYNI